MERILLGPGKDVMQNPVAWIVQAFETIDRESRRSAKARRSANSQPNVGVRHPFFTATSNREGRTRLRQACDDQRRGNDHGEGTTVLSERQSWLCQVSRPLKMSALPGGVPRLGRDGPAQAGDGGQPDRDRLTGRRQPRSAGHQHPELSRLVDQFIHRRHPNTSNRNGVATTHRARAIRWR
jgi:hypothetical protein